MRASRAECVEEESRSFVLDAALPWRRNCFRGRRRHRPLYRPRDPLLIDPDWSVV